MNSDEALAAEEADLAKRYSRRAASGRRYSMFELGHLLELQQRERVLMQELRRAGLSDLAEFRILDVGCGQGTELLRFVLRGAKATRLFGIDLLQDRVDLARSIHPEINVIQGNAAALPWEDESFELVTQFTTFSSILDTGVRIACAREMARVLEPGGHILWYDFWFNPGNRDTRGIRRPEVRSLFPNFASRFRRLTLAPPLARLVVKRSWLAATLLQELPPLQSHYLGVLRKEV